MFQHKGTQTIKTERLTLRKFIVNDSREAFIKWTSSPVGSKFVMKCPHKELQDTERMMQEWVNSYDNPSFYMWAIDFNDELIGYICGNEINEKIRSICIGYCITESLWNMGITSEAAKAVINYFFSLNFNRVFSYHNPLNPASGRVMQKCGMQFEGRIRGGSLLSEGICDCMQYAVLKSDIRD